VLRDYEIEARIGRGGMAEVLVARVREGPRAGRRVAVKRLLPGLARDEEHLKLFAAETRLAQRLRHPNVVELLEAGVDDAGSPYMVMEYVDGCDLARLLAACATRGISLPVDFALHVAQAVALALHHAHTLRDEGGRPLGIVHCDVSPSNVFASRLGEVKLGDFGVARALGEGRGQAALGKVRYLAPEQLRREPVSPRTDVHGAGALLFELLTGKHAFPGGDPDDVARQILSGARRPPSVERPDLSPEIDRLVLRALASNGRDRHPDAACLAEDLAAHHDPSVGNSLALAAVVRGLAGLRQA
jgi:eukaryotic-like serine/threonine-protein kinase